MQAPLSHAVTRTMAGSAGLVVWARRVRGVALCALALAARAVAQGVALAGMRSEGAADTQGAAGVVACSAAAGWAGLAVGACQSAVVPAVADATAAFGTGLARAVLLVAGEEAVVCGRVGSIEEKLPPLQWVVVSSDRLVLKGLRGLLILSRQSRQDACPE